MRVPVPSGWDIRFLLDVALMLASRPSRGVAKRPAAGLRKARAALWRTWLRRMAGALARGDHRTARKAWRRAYRAALDSPRWDGMVEVGSAARRLGRAVGACRAAEAQARHCYLAAAVRAAQERALAGVSRISEAFAELGDREAAEACRRIADRLATLASVDQAAAGARGDPARRELRALHVRRAGRRTPGEGPGDLAPGPPTRGGLRRPRRHGPEHEGAQDLLSSMAASFPLLPQP